MDTISEIGLLDFEAEYRLKDRDQVIDPFIGLKWHLVRSGHPGHVEAVRKRLLESPKMRTWLHESERKGMKAAYQDMAARAGNGEKKPKAPKKRQLHFSEAELEAMAAKASEADALLELLMAGELKGADLVAEHLVENLTKADGSPIRTRVLRCDDGHKWTADKERCPECSKPATGEEWQPVEYTPAIAMRIWSDNRPVAEETIVKVLGDAAYENGQPKGLGSALLAWVVGECDRIEQGLVAVGEDLGGN